MAKLFGPRGPVCFSLVGPKRPYVGMPVAEAICIKPESFEMNREHLEMAAAAVRRSAEIERAHGPIKRRSFSFCSSSSGPPKMRKIVFDDAKPPSPPLLEWRTSSWASLAKLARGQRFHSKPFALPGCNPTSDAFVGICKLDNKWFACWCNFEEIRNWKLEIGVAGGLIPSSGRRLRFCSVS